MQSKEIYDILKELNWDENYLNKPLAKYYRFGVNINDSTEYVYLERGKTARLCFHPKFIDLRNEIRKIKGVSLGGKTDLLLKSADLTVFPTVKGRTGNDIHEFLPLSITNKVALEELIARIKIKPKTKINKIDIKFDENNPDAEPQNITKQNQLNLNDSKTLTQVDNFTEFDNEVISIEAEQKKLAEYMSPTEINAWVKRRVGQGPFRTALLQEFGNKCAISELSDARLLVASHIRPWSECDEGQHRDINNGLLLSVTWDALFDKNLISFNDDGTMLISELLDGNTLEKLGVSNKPSLPESYLKTRREFLEYHRKNLLKKTSHS